VTQSFEVENLRSFEDFVASPQRRLYSKCLKLWVATEVFSSWAESFVKVVIYFDDEILEIDERGEKPIDESAARGKEIFLSGIRIGGEVEDEGFGVLM